jgi:hypothetical protein
MNAASLSRCFVVVESNRTRHSDLLLLCARIGYSPH